MTVAEALAQAADHHRAGRLAEAEGIYRRILSAYPKQADALHLLGVIACQQGRYEVAHGLITQATELSPGAADFHGNLGLVLFRLGKTGEALAAYQRAVAGRPDNWPAWLGLGDALGKLSQWTEAIAAYRRAIVLQPNLAVIHHNLARVLAYTGDYDGAIAQCEKAIRLDGKFGDAFVTLGATWLGKGDLDQAAAAYRKALELKPDRADALSNLGNIYKEMGQIGEAIALDDRALATDRSRAHFDSNRLYALHFDPAYDAAALLREHRGWAARHAIGRRPYVTPHENDRAPDRRLRIGFVSPDFRRHVVGWNLLPFFRNYNRQELELFCYSNSPMADDVTRELRGAADNWREITRLSNEQAAALIRSDRIDILVDLSLHMAANRLLLFDHKPAPVQVTYLGYCSTSGLETIDYRFSDPHLDPPGTDLACYSEKTVWYWCYEPGGIAPEVGALPALSGGGVMFGCLNSFGKVSPGALRLWASVMKQVAGSRIVLHCLAGLHRQRLLEQFGEWGIAADRIEFVGVQPWAVYMRTYQRIDIALDPFPYGGGITSCDALWMGVPVITLSGGTAVGRGGRSILSQVGLTENIADTQEGYLERAVFLASPLMDGKRFAEDITVEFRKMWIAWAS